MLAIRQWILMLIIMCIAPFSLAEKGAMSTQQQCAEYGVYRDSGENWIDCAEGFSQQQNDQQNSYKDKYEPYVDEPYVEEPYVEELYVEEPYVEEPYLEEPYVEEPYVEQPYIE